MCDYSLHGVASRPAKVRDKLVSKKFTITGGFAAVGEPNVAVCLLPGTEVAFEKEVGFECVSGRYPNWRPRPSSLRRWPASDKSTKTSRTHIMTPLNLQTGRSCWSADSVKVKRLPWCNCQLLRGRQTKRKNKSALLSLPNPKLAIPFM